MLPAAAKAKGKRRGMQIAVALEIQVPTHPWRGADASPHGWRPQKVAKSMGWIIKNPITAGRMASENQRQPATQDFHRHMGVRIPMRVVMVIVFAGKRFCDENVPCMETPESTSGNW